MSKRKFPSGDIPRVMGVGRYIATVVGALALAALTWSNVHSQITNPGVQQSGAVAANDCVKWGPGVGQIQSAGGACAVADTPAALTKADDTNVTLTLTGTPATALLQSVQVAAGWTGTLGLARGGWGADISAQSGVPSLAAGTFSWLTRGDITKADDTNVTLTLGGTPVGSVFNGVSITAGWTGTLAAARLNSNVVQGVTNDTNVTGSIAAQNLTLGWAGTLAVARGGTACGAASGTCLDNITGFASTGMIQRTGAGTYSFTTLGTGVATGLATATGAASGFSAIVATGTIALGTSAVSAGTCSSAATATATGAATTDVIDVGFNGDPTATTGYLPTAMLTLVVYPTTNTVNVKQCNLTASSITPSALTLNWKVRR